MPLSADAIFAQSLRAAKARLRHVRHGDPSYNPNPVQRGKASKASKGGAPAAAVPPEVRLGASWVLHGDGPAAAPPLPALLPALPALAESAGSAADDERPAAEAREEEVPAPAPVSVFRSVLLRMEGAVPSGCQVTIDLNGVASVLQPARRKGHAASAEKRFDIAPLGSAASEAGAGEERETAVVADAPLRQEASDDEAEGEGDEAESSDDPSAAEQPGPSGEAPAGGAIHAPPLSSGEEAGRPSGPATLAVTVILDTEEVQARTAQELVQPVVDVQEITDTGVVLRLSKLTGERFEVTVYASSGAESGAAVTLCQRGPVRLPDSVHRIGPLEPQQVYVAWVRVFCDDKVMESKQKGFKTLPPKVKTIWDEPDNEVLGIPANAEAKEITKAWRALSLRHHPDKETDPDKKEAAEDMMKRLNLAKQNMMKCAVMESPSSTISTAPPSSPADSFAQKNRADEAAADCSGGNPFGDSDDSDGDWPSWAPRAPPMDPNATEDKDSGPDAEEDKESLRCTLKVEARKPPKLRVLERSLNTLDVEATGLTVGCAVEVQNFAEGAWKAAVPRTTCTSSCMRFTIVDLKENCSYRLRLRTMAELEPLRFLFAEFKAKQQEAGPPREGDPDGPDPSEVDAVFGRCSAPRLAQKNQKWVGQKKLDPVSEADENLINQASQADAADDENTHDDERSPGSRASSSS